MASPRDQISFWTLPSPYTWMCQANPDTLKDSHREEKCPRTVSSQESWSFAKQNKNNNNKRNKKNRSRNIYSYSLFWVADYYIQRLIYRSVQNA